MKMAALSHGKPNSRGLGHYGIGIFNESGPETCKHEWNTRLRVEDLSTDDSELATDLVGSLNITGSE